MPRKPAPPPLPNTPLQRHLRRIGACLPARQWAGARTAREAWTQCCVPWWLTWWVWTVNPETENAAEVLASRRTVSVPLTYLPYKSRLRRVCAELRKRWAQPWTEPTARTRIRKRKSKGTEK
jgi:hypothetical protein